MGAPASRKPLPRALSERAKNKLAIFLAMGFTGSDLVGFAQFPSGIGVPPRRELCALCGIEPNPYDDPREPFQGWVGNPAMIAKLEKALCEGVVESQLGPKLNEEAGAKIRGKGPKASMPKPAEGYQNPLATAFAMSLRDDVRKLEKEAQLDADGNAPETADATGDVK
jgi:hypothetical protein